MKTTLIGVIFIIAMLASIAAASAATESSVYMKISGDADSIAKNKGHEAIRLNYNKKIKYYSFGESNFGNKTKVKSAVWNFGDGTKKQKGVNVYHTYKKTGWHTLKLVANYTEGNINYQNYQKTYRVYVSKKPDLKVTKLVNYVDHKNNTVFFKTTIKNQGNTKAKASTIKMWFNSKKLKKYTVTAKIPAIKIGKSVKINIYFKMPYKYRNLVKYLQIDPYNKLVESVKSNNLLKL